MGPYIIKKQSIPMFGIKSYNYGICVFYMLLHCQLQLFGSSSAACSTGVELIGERRGGALKNVCLNAVVKPNEKEKTSKH